MGEFITGNLIFIILAALSLGAMLMRFLDSGGDQKAIISEATDSTGKEYINSGELHVLLNKDFFPDDKGEKYLKQKFRYAPGPFPYFWYGRDFLNHLTTRGYSLVFSEESEGVVLNFSYRLIMDNLNYLTVLPDGRLLVFNFDPLRKILTPFLVNLDLFPRLSEMEKVENIDLTREDGKLRPVGTFELAVDTAVESRLTIRTSGAPSHLWFVLPTASPDEYGVTTQEYWLTGIDLNNGRISTVGLPWLDSHAIDITQQMPCIAAGDPEHVLLSGLNCPFFYTNGKGEFLGRKE